METGSIVVGANVGVAIEVEAVKRPSASLAA
jgi:hypothetical protein